MAKMDPDFQEKIDALERKFEVVSVIFQKYLKVFCDVFTKPEPAAKTTRHRAARKPQRLFIYPINNLLSMIMTSPFVNTFRNKLCTCYEVFSFGWTLYVHIKGENFVSYLLTITAMTTTLFVYAHRKVPSHCR